MNLSPEESHRYARHLSIPEFGKQGQERLKASRVLCIGAGGLGSPITMNLVAAGVGTLGMVENDVVELSNLQRQYLYNTEDVGKKKLDAAFDRLHALNPHVNLIKHEARLDRNNALEIMSSYDLVVDGTDNFPTRYLSNDACVMLKKPLIYGSILRFEGQCTVFAPHLGGPCYRCMSPTPPAPGLVPSCAEGGVLGILPGLIGTLQATEAIKLLTNIGQPLLGKLLHVDTLTMKFRTFNLRRDPECPVCSEHPSITELIDYENFCGIKSPTMQDHAIPSITVEQLKEAQDQNQSFFLLDVREPFEFEIASIPGSTLIPLGELAERSAEVPKDQPVYIHCKGGVRSLAAAEFLQSQGYNNVTNIEGGILAWSERIDPSVASY